MKIKDFIPLNYYQVESGDPLVLDIGYICKIEIKQLSIYNLVSVNSIVNYSIGQIKILFDNLEKITSKIKISKEILININKSIYDNYMILIEMIYSLTEYNFDKQKDKLKYRKYLIDKLINSVEKLHYVVNKILEFNSGLKKKLLDLQSFNIWQNESSTTTGEELFNYYLKKSPDQQSIIPLSLN